MKLKVISLLLIIFCCAAAVSAQAKSKYSYLKQKAFIPAELGKVYLGMPLAEFAKQIDLKQAEVDNRYGWLEATLPYAKGNIASINFKVHGLEEADYAKLIKKVTTGKTTERNENYEVEIQMLDVTKIPAKKGVVYEIGIAYKKGYDLKAQAVKMFGAATDVHKPGESPYFYDLQWTKKTADGLTWLIRYNEEPNYIMLAGLIDGTEWDPAA